MKNYLSQKCQPKTNKAGHLSRIMVPLTYTLNLKENMMHPKEAETWVTVEDIKTLTVKTWKLTCLLET